MLQKLLKFAGVQFKAKSEKMSFDCKAPAVCAPCMNISLCPGSAAAGFGSRSPL